jgi:hypothetical protein
MTPTLPDRRARLVATALVCAAAWSRLVPHWPNFTAVPAMALFGAVALGRRWQAFALPLLAMLLSDLALAAFVYGTDAFVMMPAVYAAIAATVWIGCLAGRRPWSLLLAGAGATATFFVTVNFYVWLVSDLYPATAAGLLACYLAALPYAGNMLLGTLVYGSALLAIWQLARSPSSAQPNAT